MKDQMTWRDYELISAYLDNQLSDKDRVLLESRLKSEAALRVELHEISKTRQLLKSLPQLRAPRNYFIKEQAVQTRPSLRLAPIFGIVSAVASVVFALVIFGSTLFSNTGPVAMAPAAQEPMVTENVLVESQRSVETQAIPTQEAPMTMLQAPQMETPTAPGAALKLGEPLIPTPTTVYVWAMPPTSTPEGLVGLGQVQSELSNLPCEQYYEYGSYPTYAYPDECASPTPTPTATSTYSQNLEGFLATPSATYTNTATPTATASATPSPTATPTPTETPTPTPMPSPTALVTMVPDAVEKSLATEAGELPQGLAAPYQATGEENAASADQSQVAGTQDNTNISFLSYLLLTVEISLAFIAVVAGIIAIILRIRAGR